MTARLPAAPRLPPIPTPLTRQPPLVDVLGAARDVSRVSPGGRDCWGTLASLEGSIGAGKSRLMQLVQAARTSLRTYTEPVDQWTLDVGPDERVNMLEPYYDDPPRYAFTFQCLAFTSRMSQYVAALRAGPPHQAIFAERSLRTDHLFATMLHKDGIMNPTEYAIYCRFYDAYLSAFPNFTARCVVYLRTSVETCYERIQERQRQGEVPSGTGAGISRAYLHRLHEEHEALMDTLRAEGTPVLVLDGDVGVDVFRTAYVPRVLAFIEDAVQRRTAHMQDYYNQVMDKHFPVTSPAALVDGLDRCMASPLSPYVLGPDAPEPGVEAADVIVR